MENLTHAAASMGGQSRLPGSNSPPSQGFGRPSPIRQTPLTAESIELIKALAILQDALRQFVLAGGMLRPPYINDKGILVLAIKLRGHTLGVGPGGDFILDGRSVMEVRQE